MYKYITIYIYSVYYHRVAVFGNMYQHMTIGLSSVNPVEGRRRLAETQVKQMGYHTIIVSLVLHVYCLCAVELLDFYGSGKGERRAK